jgi:CubicO group peptidase (beta-lactamase class C family)
MMPAIKRSFAYILLVILVSAPVAVRAQESVLNGFDDYVNKALKEWEVPGVAIAIVKNDKVILSKGYGVRKIGEATPVDDKTFFAIGSASKAFTAATIAMLVDEGKLKWDDPATKYLPGFQLFDPYVTREITVRDLLCHRSGLERGDLLWYGSNYSRDEILQRVRYLKPSWSFRSQFGYQNIMYLAAGQVAANVTGKSWDDIVRDRIFKPLGMNTSNTTIRDLSSLNNVAAPHNKIKEKVQAVNWRNIDNIAPAGSINSNVSEMIEWVRLHLNNGKFGDKQVISSGSVTEMHTPHTVIRREGPWALLMPEAHFLNYGLGWFLQDYRGRLIIQHGGNIDGMSALVAMMPEEKVGMVILTNMDGSPLPTALMQKAFDLFLQAPSKDWSADMLKVIKGMQGQAKAAEKKAEEERAKNTKPSLPLDKYVGTYTNDMYGEAKIVDENGKLMLKYAGAFNGTLEHWHYDTFKATMTNESFGTALVNFNLDAQGKISDLKINTPAASDLVFKRAPEKAKEVVAVSMSEADLKKYLGKYASAAPPIEVSVEMVGGQLKGIIPGQPVANFIPIAPNRFKVVVEGAPVEIFTQFDMADGKVKSMTIEQGGMKLILMPKQ